jgi:branched-chain amino acid transport system ATP-binding protein
MSAILEVTELSVSYGRVRAVRDVSVEVNAGEIVGLLGPNGAGKTTILSAIAGLVAPTEGQIRYKGEMLGGRKPEQIVRMGLALVPENRRIFNRLTVAENLQLGGTTRRDRDGERRDRKRLLEVFPALGTKLRDRAGSLSGGQQQQLSIARSLLTQPELLLLDEPSLGLDPQTVRQLFATLQELRAEGLTILLAEQNAVRTLEIADRVFVMRTGQVVLSGPAAVVASDMDYRREYLGGNRGNRTDAAAEELRV